jgi:hypothetical protein
LSNNPLERVGDSVGFFPVGKGMTKAKRYDTVVLIEPMGKFQKGEKGVVVVYTTPYEAYDIEIVSDDGKTKGIAEGVRPEHIEVSSRVRFASIRVEAEGARAAVRFSNGTEVAVSAEELYTQLR